MRWFMATFISLLLLATASFAAMDIESPHWSNPYQSAQAVEIGDTINFTAYWTDDVALDTAWLQMNWTLAGNPMPSYSNIQSVQVSGTSATTRFSVTVPAGIPAGTAVGWKIWMLDGTTKSNTTTAMSFTTKDTQPPTLLSIAQSSDTGMPNKTITISLNATDNAGLSKARLVITDEKGTKDYSIRSLSGASAQIMFNYTVPWSFTPGTSITWLVYVTDMNGNTVATPTKTINLPACPDFCAPNIPPGGCMDWGQCNIGNETRTCFNCGVETSFQCVATTQNRACPLEVTRTEAERSISAAETAVNEANDAKKNVTLALASLEAARNAASSGSWGTAKLQADKAKALADTALPLPPPPWPMLQLIVIVIIIVVLFLLWKLGLLKELYNKLFKRKKEGSEEELLEEQEQAENEQKEGEEEEKPYELPEELKEELERNTNEEEKT